MKGQDVTLLTCTRFDHLGCWDDLLRESRSSHIGEHELALLDGLRPVADCFSSSLRCNSSMAAHCHGELDIGNASAGYSGNDRRSSSAFQPINFHAEATCHVWRKIWSMMGICLTHHTPIPSMRGWKTILGT